jgi:diadenosine tetraphosphate (Ap4A) HIT family hydrolase
VAVLFDLPAAEQLSLWSQVAVVRQLLIEQYNPDGFNVGVNEGLAAGQTVPHAHIHVIPRRHGDVADPRGGVRWVIPAKAQYW